MEGQETSTVNSNQEGVSAVVNNLEQETFGKRILRKFLLVLSVITFVPVWITFLVLLYNTDILDIFTIISVLSVLFVVIFPPVILIYFILKATKNKNNLMFFLPHLIVPFVYIVFGGIYTFLSILVQSIF